MNNIFKNLPPDVCNELNGTLQKWKYKTYMNLINEALGSFPCQYDIVKQVVDKIYAKIKNNDYTIENEYKKIIFKHINITYIVFWKDVRLEDDYCTGLKTTNEKGDDTITLTIQSSGKSYKDLSSTIAHEIMHCFQTRLPEVNGVNYNSKLLHYYVLDFYHNAPSLFSSYFFYGLYICFSLERSANISSISSYLERYFLGKSFNNEDVKNVLSECDKYQPYIEVIGMMENPSYTRRDFQYIRKVMTQGLVDPETRETVYLCGDDFNVQEFIKVNRESLIKVSRETLKKMDRNAMLFIEKHLDSEK